jgi:TetR/AcrR family transcriptional regulator, transcriptional repressor for nem operon
VDKGDGTRALILDAAHAAVVAKGLEATSIEELIAETGLARSEFFSHFRDKSELARALLKRILAEDEWACDAIFARARDLVDDPLQVFVVGLRFLADRMADMPRGHAGCHFALSCCLERLHDHGIQELNRQGALRKRARFRAMFEEIAAVHPPREPIDADDFADMVSTVLEGAIVMANALDDPGVPPRQIMVLRTYVKLLFAPARGA